MSLCLVAAGIAVEIAASAFTLSWTHTVEKTLWQEEWRVEAHHLVLQEARVEGSGAGMEPPPDARLVNGAYVWRPNREQATIVLRRDPHAGDWRLCAGGRCDTLGKWLGVDADPVSIAPGVDGCAGEGRQ
jgi:hypothetical protein